MLNLVIVAHPDDEILGFGGSGYTKTMNGELVQPVILCGKVNARTRKPEDKLLQEDIEKANNLLGFNSPILGDFPNLAMNTIPHLKIVQFIEDQIIKFKPDRIFTHHPNDLNDDHRQVSNACVAASRFNQRNLNKESIKGVYFMEILSSTEWAYQNGHLGFNPNIFVDINESLTKKLESLDCYRNVMRKSPHPRSESVVKALAKYRGAQIGFKYAESFQICYQRDF